MRRGIFYIMEIEGLPDVMKIGLTSRTAHERATEVKGKVVRYFTLEDKNADSLILAIEGEIRNALEDLGFKRMRLDYFEGITDKKAFIDKVTDLTKAYLQYKNKNDYMIIDEDGEH